MVDEIKCKALLYKLLAKLTSSFNVGKTMDANQIGEAILLILSDAVTKNFKPDDFVLCFDMMKKGQFGKSFDRIDVQTIFEAMYAYWDLKAAEAEKMAIKRHFEAIKEPPPEEINTEGQKKVLEILQEAKKLGEEKEVKPAKYKIEKSPKDQFVQDCFLEFYQIWLKNPYKEERKKPMPGLEIRGETGGRYIEYNGKPVDEVEYAQIKVKEFNL